MKKFKSQEPKHKSEEKNEPVVSVQNNFIAHMSHELRSPLNAILGFSQLLAHNKQLPAESREQASIIYRSGEHLLALINQVLDLSKMESGQENLEENNFDLYALLHELEEMFILRAEEKRLKLVLQWNKKLPRYICADESKLRQILHNLFSNAIKFTSQGGVELRVEAQTNPSSSGKDLEIFFELEDSGCGISREEFSKVFLPFQQTKSGEKIQEGTGLGMSISASFVRLMGGKISLESKLNKGSTFRFSIQAQLREVYDVPIKKKHRKVLGLKSSQKKFRLLIADDDKINSLLLRKILEPLEVECKEAENGEKAIDLWRKFCPHLILMDIKMPLMGGLEACQYIKNHSPEKAPIVIALGVSGLPQEKSLLRRVGCDDLLEKPIQEFAVFALLEKYLGLEYIYEENKEEMVTQSAELRFPNQLAMLPEFLQEKLEEAATQADLENIQSMVGIIRQKNPLLALTISGLAHQFDYGKILEGLEEAKSIRG